MISIVTLGKSKFYCCTFGKNRGVFCCGYGLIKKEDMVQTNKTTKFIVVPFAIEED